MPTLFQKPRQGRGTIEPRLIGGAVTELGWRSSRKVLREAGAAMFGKTTTPEFGCKAETNSPLTGISRNPWDPSKTPGGSSGGTAAAVAAGLGPIGVGTDGAGSVRIPAAFCGNFGLKPSFGRVPAYPLSPFGTVAHLGPHTMSVADAALASKGLKRRVALIIQHMASAPPLVAAGVFSAIAAGTSANTR